MGSGHILWLTGPPCAGKTTLAFRMEKVLKGLDFPVEVLDGDRIRTTLCRGLGFSRKDRLENIRRIGFVARLLARHGVVVIVSAITPYRGQRDEQCALAECDGIPFTLAYVAADLGVLKARDVKGLYKKADWGHVKNFTGVSDPYQEPRYPDVVVHTDKEAVDESAAKILRAFVENSLKKEE